MDGRIVNTTSNTLTDKAKEFATLKKIYRNLQTAGGVRDTNQSKN